MANVSVQDVIGKLHRPAHSALSTLLHKYVPEAESKKYVQPIFWAWVSVQSDSMYAYYVHMYSQKGTNSWLYTLGPTIRRS